MKTKTAIRRPAVRIGAVFCVLSLLFPQYLGSETLTMVTTYPSPMGVYKNIVTTGQTLLARDGGQVGIGTPTPTAALEADTSTAGRQAGKFVSTAGEGLYAESDNAGYYAGHFINPAGHGLFTEGQGGG